jgi:hypothetical protein
MKARKFARAIVLATAMALGAATSGFALERTGAHMGSEGLQQLTILGIDLDEVLTPFEPDEERPPVETD